MRSAVSFAGLVAVLAAAAGFADRLPATVPANIRSIRCEYRAAGYRMAAGKTRVYYVPPDTYRIQIPGGLVFLGNESAGYRYSPRFRRAVRFPADEPLFTPVNPAYLDLVIKASKKVGREPISGKMCDVYVLQKNLEAPGSGLRYGEPGTKVWIWKEGRVVLKTHYGAPEGGVSYICTRVEFNTDMPAAKFALPLGTVVKAPPSTRR